MEDANPFAQEEEPGDIASVAYRYFELSFTINFCLCRLCLHSPCDSGFVTTEISQLFVKTKLLGICVVFLYFFFKPPLPVGAGGGYIFSGPSVPLSVHASVRPSVHS